MFRRRPRWMTVCLCCAVLSCTFAVRSHDALAAGNREVVQEAAGLVQEALHREVYGLWDQRDELLGRAAALAPDYAPVKWHQGYVAYQGQWIQAEDAAQWSSRDARLAEYKSLRAPQPDTVAAHLRLATWCRTQGLDDQARAHWLRVLDLNPDQPQARARLGFRRVEGGWATDEEVDAANRERRATAAALAKWRARIEELRDRLDDRAEKKRTTAAASVRALRDAEAIPALEAILSSHSEQSAQLVVEALGQMPEQEATRSLSTLAITSPWPAVRSAAARELGRRAPESYVPGLLGAMYTPLVSQLGVAPLETGGLAYRHAFLREGQDERQLLVLDTRYRRVPMPGGDRSETQSRAWRDSLIRAVSREQSVAEQNRNTETLNQRIADALSIATGQQLPSDPHRWWNWWNQENSVVEQSEKQLRTIQRTTQLAVSDQPTPIGLGGGQAGSSPAQARAECFVAGTPVWTIHGPVDIDKLRVGDLVLSQNVETGELAFKPVVRTSVRPAEPLTRVQIGDETLLSTSGHLLWVSGKGWVKAGKLESGMQVHCLNGALPVLEVEQNVAGAETYNLAIDGFSTYFAGAARLLSHDVTNLRPTRKLLPGLSER